jgi:hypothetical protein
MQGETKNEMRHDVAEVGPRGRDNKCRRERTKQMDKQRGYKKWEQKRKIKIGEQATTDVKENCIIQFSPSVAQG